MYLLGLEDSQNILKIAVMGMGVAGSYLMARLKDSEHDVTGYELNPKRDTIQFVLGVQSNQFLRNIVKNW